MSDSSSPTAPPESPASRGESDPGRTLRKLRLTGVLVLIIAAELALWIVSGRPLREAADHFAGARYEAARIRLERPRAVPLRNADLDWMLAAARLASGHEAEAEPLLDRVRRRGRRFFPPLRREDVLEVLVRQGRFEGAILWAESARTAFGTTERERVLHAAALTGAGRLDEARSELAGVSESDRNSGAIEALRRAMVDRQRGLVPVVYDADGEVLALWRISDGRLLPSEPSTESLVRALEREQDIEGPWPALHLSIRSSVQRELLPLLGRERGTIAVAEIRTRRLIGLASTERGAGLAPIRLGSLARVAIPARQGLYPITCDGFLRLQSVTVRDSGRHGQVPDHESALAWGCIVAAGRAALAQGAGPMNALLEAAGISAEVGSEADLARLGSHESSATASPVQLAELTAGLASDGVRRRSPLVERRTSILGEPLDAQTESRTPLGDAGAVSRVREGMRRSVLEGRGEAHSLAVRGFDVAALPGTLAREAGGFSARIIAFAPTRDPRYAIAVALDGSGPGSSAGTEMLGRVLDAIRYEEVPDEGS